MTREEWDALTADDQFEYAKLCDAQITACSEVIKQIPPCPSHGDMCLLHAETWIVQWRTYEAAMKVIP